MSLVQICKNVPCKFKFKWDLVTITMLILSEIYQNQQSYVRPETENSFSNFWQFIDAKSVGPLQDKDST